MIRRFAPFVSLFVVFGLVLSLYPTTTKSAVPSCQTDDDCDGFTAGPGHKLPGNSPASKQVVAPDRQTAGVSIGLVETGGYLYPRDRLIALGYSVAMIPPTSGIDILRNYSLVYLPVCWADDDGGGDRIAIESNASDYHNYVAEGGGLLVEQPNEDFVSAVLPHPITFEASYDSSDFPPVVVDSDHPITTGLAPEDLPFPADQMTSVDSFYHTLVVGGSTGLASLVVGEYGLGRVLVHTAHPHADAGHPFSDEAYRRMIEWVRTEGRVTETIHLPVVAENYNSALEYTSARIDADSGGSISLGNLTLEVPPGALSEDTTMTMSRPINSPDVGDRGIGYLQLLPSGLVLSAPASLSIGYEEPLTFEEKWLAVYTYNGVQGRWEKLDVVSRDTTNNQVLVHIDHFSYFTTIFDRPLDLVLHLPGSFLRKGDLIYTLALTEGSTKFSWFPGHAALYLGSSDPNADPNDPNDNDGQMIIESTPGDFNSSPGCMDGGVRLSDFSDGYYSFVKAPYHLYMGARRLAGISDEDRTNIASYALSKLDRGYFLVASGNLGDSCYSCVGLTEAAYDDAGASIIPAILEFPFIIPLEQYIRTRPVDEITVWVGHEVDFAAKRVYWSVAQDQYVADSWVAILDCPSGATCSGGSVSWIPTEANVGNHTIRFSTDVTIDGKSYSASQTLTINVIAAGVGAVTGLVVDATTGNGLSGALVSIDGTGHSAVAGSDGSYTLDGVSAGSYTITADRDGYIPISRDVTVFANETAISNIALPTATYPDDIVITLTWGEYPRDLDSHLWLPASEPFHVYFSNRGSLTSFPFAKLDVDDVYSYGPENITIRQQYDGTYTYAVYNYSGSPDITTSSAQVTIFKDGAIQTFDVPTTGFGRWWYVFDYDAVTGSVIPRDFITDTAPGEYSASSSESETK